MEFQYANVIQAQINHISDSSFKIKSHYILSQNEFQTFTTYYSIKQLKFQKMISIKILLKIFKLKPPSQENFQAYNKSILFSHYIIVYQQKYHYSLIYIPKLEDVIQTLNEQLEKLKFNELMNPKNKKYYSNNNCNFVYQRFQLKQIMFQQRKSHYTLNFKESQSFVYYNNEYENFKRKNLIFLLLSLIEVQDQQKIRMNYYFLGISQQPQPQIQRKESKQSESQNDIQSDLLKFNFRVKSIEKVIKNINLAQFTNQK